MTSQQHEPTSWTARLLTRRTLVVALIVAGLIGATAVYGALPDWLRQLVSGLTVAAAAYGIYRTVLRFRERRGRGPLEGWARSSGVIAAGVIAFVYVVPVLINGVFGLLDQLSPWMILLHIAGIGAAETGVVVIMVRLVRGGVQKQLFTRKSGNARGAVRVRGVQIDAENWAGADEESRRILEVLTTPGKINRLFFDAGLFVGQFSFGLAEHSPLGPATTRSAKLFDVLASIPTRGKLRVDGREVQVPVVRAVGRTSSGVVASLSVLPGLTHNAYDRAADVLETALMIKEVRVSESGEDRKAGRMQMTFMLKNALSDTVRYDTALPVSYKSIPFGKNEAGERVALGLLGTNVLFGGLPGGGKSGGLTCYLAGISRLPNVAIVGIDPKRVEQADWVPRFSRIARTPEEITDTLDRLLAEMQRRYEALESMPGRKKVTEDLLDQMPLIVTVIDELAEVVASGSTRDEQKADADRAAKIRRLISLGRAAGLIIITATQKPDSSTIPTNLRDLIQQRVAYATTNADMTDTILGRGMNSNGGDASSIASDEQGVCYIVNESSRTPIKARTFWVPDEEVPMLAAQTANLRVQLDWLESRAA